MTEPWHEDYLLDEDEGIKVRIDDAAVSQATAWAVGDDLEALCEESQDPATYDAFFEMTIAYWCDRITAGFRETEGGPSREDVFYDADGNPDFDIYEHLSRGGVFIMHNCMNGKEYELTRELLAEGIGKALRERYAACGFAIGTMVEENYLQYDGKARVYRLGSPEDARWEFGDEAFQLALFDDRYYDHVCLRMFGAIRIYIPEYRPFAQ